MEKIVQLISKNYIRFRDTSSEGIRAFASYNAEIKDFLKTLNPLLLMDQSILGSYIDIDYEHPMDQNFKFNDYVKYVNEIHSFIAPVPDPIDNNEIIPLIETDYTERPLPLFNYSGSEYYGHRDIVYGSILCLREIKDIANFDQLITLNGRIPKYIMNQWIGSMYSKRFDMMKILPCDILSFLNHIDQYPTDFLTICTIEYDLIRYLDINSHDIVFEDLIPGLKEISVRCRLKRLYLWIHNKQSIINEQ
jgi:hypothetical protein